MEFNSMIDVGADQLLAKAEKLLLDVTSCIKIEAPRNRIQESKLVKSLLQNNAEAKPVKTYDPESDMTQIEWLLRGVPEAYEDEPQVDDEIILALLKEGGNPPSQLILPSIYATNQLVLEKLSNARRLRIHITNILVLSVRYGVRKEGTFLRIYPPSGCALPSNEAASIILPLHELQDPQGQIGALLRKNDKRDSLRNYFVGALDMNRSMELDLLMSEKVVRDWLHSKPEGSLRIEVHGYLSPHATVVRGTLSEAVLLATAVVPLGGLLGTPSLDAVVHCDLHVDAYSHATVLSRMRNITSAPSVSKQKTLGPKLGTVTVRVSVLPAKEKASTAATNNNSTRDHKLLHEVEPLLLPVKDVNDTDGVEPTDNVHSALGYLPTEHANQPQPSQLHFRPFQRQDLNRPVYGPSDQVNGVFALALCGLEGLSVPIEKAVEIQQHADQTGVEASAQIVLSFKTQARERESVPVDFDLAKREHSLHVNVSNGKMYYTDTLVWVAPVIEVWLTWTAATSLQLSPAPTPQPGAAQDAPGPSSIECRHLLGLAKFAPEYKLGTLIELPVMDVARGVQRGVLVTAAVLGVEEQLVENSLLCLLNFYSLRRTAVRAPEMPVDAMKASPSNPHQHHQQHPQGEDKSKHDAVDDAGNGDANETEEQEDLEPEADHDDVNETNDSIGDIIAFLNDRNHGHHGQDHPKPRPGHHPLATSTSSMNEFLAQEDRAAGTAGNQGVPTMSVLPADNDVSRNDKHAADVAISDVVPDIKPRQDSDRTSLHLLDFSVDGEFSAVRPVHAAYTPANIVGCYVKYTLPDLRDVNGVDSYALWWDGDCAVLNGSLRHQLELSTEENGRHQESVSEEALGEALGLSSCVKFFFYLADAEGNIPTTDPVVVGEAALSLSTLAQFINGNSGFAVFELPISLHHAALSRLDDGFEVLQSSPKFLLKVSHRIEPVLLRRSRDPTHYAVQPPLPALKHENVSPRASTEQPAWRVRYATDPQQQEVSPSQGQVDVTPEHLSLTDAPFPATNVADNAHEAGPHRADPVSRLLGFELTQEDLDGILYFRDPAAPLPWVPFEGSELLNDPRRRPVLTSALGGKAITTKAKDEEVDLDAALQKSIYELEYIENMFRRSHESDTHLPTGRRENSNTTHGVNDLPAADDDGDDDDTEMYKSDFESLDDEPNIDYIIGSIERDHRTPKTGIAFQPLGVSSNNLEETVESDNSQYFSDGPPADEVQSDSDLEEEGEELSSVSTSHSAAEASIYKRVAALKSLVLEHFNLATGKREEEMNDAEGSFDNDQNAEAMMPESNEVFDNHQEAAEVNSNAEEHAHDDDDLCLSARSDDENDSPEMRDLDEESTSFAAQREHYGQEDSDGVERKERETADGEEGSSSDLDSLQVSTMELAVAEVNDNNAAQDEAESKVADLAAEELRLRFDSPENVAFVDEVMTPIATREAAAATLLLEQKEEGQLNDEELPAETETKMKVEERKDEAPSEHEEEESDVHVIIAPDAAMHHIEESTQTEPREMSLSMDMDFTMDVSVSKLADNSAHSALTADSVVRDDSAVSAESAAAQNQDISQTLRGEDSHEPSFAHYSVHVSLRADPDESLVRNSFESAQSSSAPQKEDSFRTDDQSGHLSSESVRSAASATSVGSAQSRASRFDTGTDDSPDTSKIKNIVDKQIEKYFGPDVLLPHSSAESSSSSHPAGHPVPPHSSFSSPPRGIDPQAVQQWYHRTDHLTAPIVAPIVHPAPVRPPTETELFRANLSKVQALLPVSLGAAGTRGAARKHPGWQGRFLDKETDRASHIMSGVFSKSDHV